MEYQQFEQIVAEAMYLNMVNRQEPEDAELRAMLGPVEYVRQCGTVHINCGRSTGKTTFIRRQLDRVDTVVIVPSFAVKLSSYKGFQNVVPVQDIRGCPKVKTIFVDEPALVFGVVRMQSFFNYVVRTPDQLIVLLGE